MRFQIPYKLLADSSGLPGTYLHCVVLSAEIGLPTSESPRTRRFEALIDSGATRTLFHSHLARSLGLDLKSGQPEAMHGIGGREITYLHRVTLFVPGGPFVITAGFKEDLPIAGVLGMQGFFEFFRITFDPDSKTCELETANRA